MTDKLKNRENRCYQSRHSSNKNGLIESKHWSFDESEALLQIWSQINLKSFQTKSLCYKQIQIELKKQGFHRNTEQIRCKIKRLISKKSLCSLL